jgi:hypothetical protein
LHNKFIPCSRPINKYGKEADIESHKYGRSYNKGQIVHAPLLSTSPNTTAKTHQSVVASTSELYGTYPH